MIVIENVVLNNNDFTKSISDNNFMIRKIGTDELYTEAYDLPTSNFAYEETDISVVTEELESN